MYEYDEELKKLDFSHNPFSMPQGELEALENKDPLDIRKANFYGNNGDGRTLTPYHQSVDDNVIGRIVEELGRTIATADDAREMLDLKGADRTGI